MQDTSISPVQFPDWFSPVFVKELRQGLRANSFVLPFIGAQILAILAVLLEMVLGYFGSRAGMSGGIMTSGGFFFPFLFLVFSLAMPLTLFGALQPEISSGRNVELLLMSNLSRWQIVRGKFLVGCVLSGLMMISLLPYLLIRYFVGEIELTTSMGNVAALMWGNALMNAIVIGSSGIRNYVGRVFMILLITISYSIVSSVMGIAITSGGGTMALMMSMVGSSLLYIVLGLQLGRARLRVFENPLDPPSIALVIALIILSPIILGITMGLFLAAGGTWGRVAGGLVVVGLLTLSLLLDREPGKTHFGNWTQP